MDQLVYPPWLLRKYTAWWAVGPLYSLVDVEFAILLLRICSYASQFLPSPSHTIDRIRGMFLADIRTACDNAAENLDIICTRVDARGSLLRVQYLCYAGLGLQCDGGTNAFWESLNRAVRVAQTVGIQKENSLSTHDMNEFGREMRRRVFCNLYIWDRYETGPAHGMGINQLTR